MNRLLVKPKNYTCTTCTKKFLRFESQVKSKKVYCSFACRKTKQEKSCIACGTKFTAILSRVDIAKYCSNRCRDDARIGKPAWNKGKPAPWFAGDKNPRWNGGKMTHESGYILTRAKNHPHATQTGYVRAHRLAMEEHLGRYLLPEEDVHHLDDDKTNNDISNLELFAGRSEHLKKYHREGGKATWFKKGIKRSSVYAK